ncbi:MAG: sugar phosphorylase [Planctomycetota bacterium]
MPHPSSPQAADFSARLRQRLNGLYGAEAAAPLTERIVAATDSYAGRIAGGRLGWDEQDVVLIAYGDQVSAADKPPLETLRRLLDEQRWSDLVSTVHILPFCPYTSDDGFSVTDYLAVDPALGDWSHIEKLGNEFRLMFDLVLNHASAQGDWFNDYLQGRSPYDRFFIEADPHADLSAVVRPRSSPLLTPFSTNRGEKHVWTTFSADQVDLNYQEPELLAKMLETLLEYAARGAQIVRLDAVGFLWKQTGTSCMHLPQTHEVVKLMRDVVSAAAPHVWILTETNVPHRENVSYFGDGDEAQIVYQFSLPPLLLDAFVHGDATYLMRWLADLEPPPKGCTQLNFTASHDGVGVRALEGLAPPERLDSLVAAVQSRQGLVSTRRRGDQDVPYELNIAYVDALTPDGPIDDALHARRFLSTQAVMLALQGIPAVYFHSLVGSRNDLPGVAESGQNRRINRRKFSWDELHRQIDDGESLSGRIYQGYRRLLSLRRKIRAFHPNAEQKVIPARQREMISFVRRTADAQEEIVVAVNAGAAPTTFDAAAASAGHLRYDLIGDESIADASCVRLLPGQAVWLAAGPIL